MLNRVNFGKSIAAARSLLELNRLEFASRAGLGQETIARAERGEDAVSLKILSTIQDELERSGIEFPDGTILQAVRLREFSDLSQCGVVADPSMPKGVRFQSPATAFSASDICSYLNVSRETFDQWLEITGAPSPIGPGGFQTSVMASQRSTADSLGLTPFPTPFIRVSGISHWRSDQVKLWVAENQQQLSSRGVNLAQIRF